MTPQLVLDEQYAYVPAGSTAAGAEQWRFLEADADFLVAMGNGSAASACRGNAGFSYDEPRYVEQYWVHLGEQTQFQPLDMVAHSHRVPAQAWPGASATASQVARQEAQRPAVGAVGPCRLSRLPVPLPAKPCPPGAEPRSRRQAAGMSPATLKRKLHKHDTGFQQQVDLVSSMVSGTATPIQTRILGVCWDAFSTVPLQRLGSLTRAGSTAHHNG